MRSRTLAALAFSLSTVVATSQTSKESVRFDNLLNVEPDSLHNIHIRYEPEVFSGRIRVVYGHCELASAHQRHHEVVVATIDEASRPDRLVWIVPRDLPQRGCLHAFSGEELVGRSAPITASISLRKRQHIAEVADEMGPWFDGVAYMQSRNVSSTASTEAKSKRIAIVGGGMSGLMTSLLLESVGMHNWHIAESTQRVGGRVRTKYLNNTRPDQYQYQEMGPMRFPVTVQYAGTNDTVEINDHKMVFQLADTLNKSNGGNASLAVNFIPWIQNSPNTPVNSGGVRLPGNRIPSKSQLAANSSLSYKAASSNATAVKAATDAVAAFEDMTADRIKTFALNVYQAHKDAVDRGLFHWSEANYIRYQLGLDANLTDYIAGAAANDPLWAYDDVYFAATTWRTTDKGLSSLPRAFTPLVSNKTTFGRKVEGLAYNKTSDQISIQYRPDAFQVIPETETYDYAIVAVPFSKVRGWRLPRYSSLLSRAISNMNYQQSCKVALHYKTRFWEKMSPPIIGGCGSVDIYGIGSVCYPAYTINATGPGVLLASYTSGTPARTVAALSEKDHIALAQRAMIEVHGQVAADQFTGIYERQCWEVDEHQAGAWADPLVGQQELYLPAYYNTEFKTIFVGEHTSYTHAWIFSALDSALRGTSQLLLDLGLVDEAKQIVNTWMARWITL